MYEGMDQWRGECMQVKYTQILYTHLILLRRISDKTSPYLRNHHPYTIFRKHGVFAFRKHTIFELALND
jgi:hypothetical protein